LNPLALKSTLASNETSPQKQCGNSDDCIATLEHRTAKLVKIRAAGAHLAAKSIPTEISFEKNLNR
jgi:hypothetical protein